MKYQEMYQLGAKIPPNIKAVMEQYKAQTGLGKSDQVRLALLQFFRMENTTPPRGELINVLQMPDGK